VSVAEFHHLTLMPLPSVNLETADGASIALERFSQMRGDAIAHAGDPHPGSPMRWIRGWAALSNADCGWQSRNTLTAPRFPPPWVAKIADHHSCHVADVRRVRGLNFRCGKSARMPVITCATGPAVYDAAGADELGSFSTSPPAIRPHHLGRAACPDRIEARLTNPLHTVGGGIVQRLEVDPRPVLCVAGPTRLSLNSQPAECAIPPIMVGEGSRSSARSMHRCWRIRCPAAAPRALGLDCFVQGGRQEHLTAIDAWRPPGRWRSVPGRTRCSTSRMADGTQPRYDLPLTSAGPAPSSVPR